MSDDGEKKPLRLVKIKEACAYARMSRSNLYIKLNRKIIRAYKRDGETMIDLNSIDEMNAALPAYVPRHPS